MGCFFGSLGLCVGGGGGGEVGGPRPGEKRAGRGGRRVGAPRKGAGGGRGGAGGGGGEAGGAGGRPGGALGQSAVHEGSEATLGPPQELEVRARSAPDF